MGKGVIEKVDGGHLVVKQNDLVEATYRLSLQEQRLILILCSKIKPEDENFHSYVFSARDLANEIGIEGNSFHSNLKKTTRSILLKTLTVYKPESTLQAGWLSSAEYFEKEGTVELCFDPKLKPYLLQVKAGFTAYRLAEALSFKSKYSLRVFEVVKRFQSKGKYVFDLKEFREMIGLADTELANYGHFRTRVLEPSVKEINEKTNLIIGITPQKTGRAISHLLLSVATKPDAPVKPEAAHLDAPGLEDLLDLIPDSLRRLKATKNRLIKALQRHDAAYIKQQIEYTNKKNPKKESYLNYLGKAIDDNYAEPETELSEEKKKISEAEREKKLAEYRLMSDKDIKDLAERGNDYAKTILFERAQTTINWTVEAQAEPAQAPAESTDSIWTDDQLAEMAASGNARAQAILTERIQSQIKAG